MNRPPYNAPPGFDWVVRLKKCRLDDKTLRATGETYAGFEVQLIAQAVTPEIWRYTVLPPGSTLPPPTGMVIGPGSELMPLKVLKTTTGIRVEGPRLQLLIAEDPWTLQFLDSDGNAVCAENPSDVDGLGRLFILPLGFVRNDKTTMRVTQSFRLHPDEHIFGLGEKFTPVDKKGQRIVTWNLDALGSTSERSHKNIPFLMSTRGYGLFVNTGARITWDIGNVSCQSYTIATDASILDVYIIAGPSPGEILKRFADLTGHAPVPPKWSFGLWVSSGGTYRDRPSIEMLIAGLEQHNIPADVVHIDPWWMKWRHYCDFRWDEEAFPHPKEFITNLHSSNLKLCLWEHSYVSVESDLFQEGKRRGFFAKRPDGEVYIIDYGLSLAPRPDGGVREATPENSWNAPVAIIDLTNPQAYAWFQDLHRPVFRLGADVFKTDFGEDIPEDAVFSNGETGSTMHNLYPLLYNKAVFEVTEQEKRHGVVWSRSGTAGNQRYPVCWSGDPAADFDSLACTIRGGISAGLSGIPFWSNDIGAYRGTPSPQLYVRWAQFGLFCSHSRMHGDSPREPWRFGEEALSIVRRYIQLRYQLFPYLYSSAFEASEQGIPIMRAMPLAFPSDVNTFDKDLQYMLGPWLLVAPIYDQTDRRSVYLPEGRWIDYWDGKSYEGPQNISVQAPLEVLPLFVRAGAILPTMPPVNRIPEHRIDPLIVELHPHESSSYSLHEDEGRVTFTCEEAGKSVIFSWESPISQRLIVRIRGSRKPLRVSVLGEGSTLQEVRPSLQGRAWDIEIGNSVRGRLRFDHTE